MGPPFSPLRSDDAIAFIVEPEQRGSGGSQNLEKERWKKCDFLPPSTQI